MRRSRALILTAAAVAATGTAAVVVALPASAAAPTATFAKTSDWGAGWQGQYTIRNEGTTPLTSWKVEFDLPAGTTVGSFWDGLGTSAGQHHAFTNREWNGAVAPGASVTFGLIGVGPGSPLNCKLNGASCTGGGSGNPTTAPPASGKPSTAPPAAPTTAPVTAPPATTAPPAGDTPANPTTGPGSNLLPLRVTNKSGRGEAVHLYMLGELNGKLGYVDRAGAFTPWSGGANPPVPAPDVSVDGPRDGDGVTVQVPRGLSGRLYFSFGDKLTFKLTPDGLVQPAVQNPADDNADVLFDWTEFTFNSSGLWINSSQVDHFAIPHAVSVTTAAGKTRVTGAIKPGGREKVFAALSADPDWKGTVVTRDDGVKLRALAPGKAADAGTFSRTYLDGYISSVWNTYKSQTLTVVPFQLEPGKKFFGRTDASGQTMNFTDGAGKQVYSIRKPATADVWGCDGALVAPNDAVGGPIARSLCASFNRSTLGKIHTAPTYEPAQFYQGDVTNFYSKVVHEAHADGKAYGFAFDDVAAQESLVHDGDPRGAGVVLEKF
ncbi:beta-1,3-glucanase family protein [Spirilliplanes yamanashiensis]|uniref:Uncharacterized protein n=1 Tax=Spirilliplanes yamanashiensis TaxID=42233 RepID=A0A8J3YCT4_9ACTN|nr:beta-1,3-glucanase family protein [Spirilliplanes yamanashiensis]MDP9818947.1 hypothetical protein [Spirilliplanes yamanashiensis]GIJ05402.1 hypothetical protein Sya03_47540 [Spirilliplanes yamanashiensis]